jgi:peptidyl-prolyl cis-trans isomerase D
MSIIQTIRDKGSWAMVTLLVLALISFIFMDGKSSLFGGDQNKTIGNINGSKIKQDEFQKRVSALRTAYKGNPQATEQAISNAVWQMMVDEKTMKSEFAGIMEEMDTKTLTDAAIGKYGIPSQYMTQLFKTSFGEQVLDQRGLLNPQTAELALKQMRTAQNTPSQNQGEAKEFMNAFENLLPIVQYEMMSNRYTTLMQNTVYAPKWMAAKQLAEEKQMTNISFVTIPYAEVNDSTVAEVKVTDNDIANYIAKNKDKFKAAEERDIDYVVYDFNATSEDSAAIRNGLATKLAIMNTTSDSNMVNFINGSGSAIPYNNVYMRKNQLAIDSNGTYTKGTLVNPFVKEGAMVVAKVLDVRNYADSASARHILINSGVGRDGKMTRDDASAKKLIDSVVALYTAGQNFDSLAKKFSEDPGSKDSGGLYKSFALNTMVPEFNEFAFTKNAGETGVVKTSFGYHFMKSEGQKGVAKPAYKVAYIAKLISPSEKTRETAQGLATSFSSNNRTGKSFDEFITKNPNIVKRNGYQINRTTLSIAGLNPADESVSKVAKWAFAAKVNDVSEPFLLKKSNIYVIAKLVRTQDEGTKSVADVRKDVLTMGIIGGDKKYTYLAAKYKTFATLEEAATKTGKSVMTKDSVSFVNGVIPGLSPEARVVGYAFSKDGATKLSGPIKGTTGLFYVKANVSPYANPTAATMDIKMYQKQLDSKLGQALQIGAQAYKKNVTIKDRRLENDLQ